MAVAQGEGRQCLEVHLLGAIGGEELGRDLAELEALTNELFRDAEAARDRRHRLVCVDQCGEGLELIGRVHRLADDILRQRELRRIPRTEDRKRVVEGTGVAVRLAVRGRRMIKKEKETNKL